MMEYTGKYKEMKDSIDCGEDVFILEYKSEDSFPYCECSMCGKFIKKKMYVIQSKKTDIELMHLGSDCVKKFK